MVAFPSVAVNTAQPTTHVCTPDFGQPLSESGLVDFQFLVLSFWFLVTPLVRGTGEEGWAGCQRGFSGGRCGGCPPAQGRAAGTAGVRGEGIVGNTSGCHGRIRRCVDHSVIMLNALHNVECTCARRGRGVECAACLPFAL